MKVRETGIHGCSIIDYRRYEDDRGWYAVTFESSDYTGITKGLNFIQDSETFSRKGTLRGMHFQTGKFAQAKLVRVSSGIVFDVVLDIRPMSPTFGVAESFVLDSDDAQQLFVPRGCAHGFLVTSDFATFSYKVDNVYSPEHEAGIHWRSFGMKWPLGDGLVAMNKRDNGWPTFEEWKNEKEPDELDQCANDDPDDMCDGCNCWKHTRAMCS